MIPLPTRQLSFQKNSDISIYVRSIGALSYFIRGFAGTATSVHSGCSGDCKVGMLRELQRQFIRDVAGTATSVLRWCVYGNVSSCGMLRGRQRQFILDGAGTTTAVRTGCCEDDIVIINPAWILYFSFQLEVINCSSSPVTQLMIARACCIPVNACTCYSMYHTPVTYTCPVLSYYLLVCWLSDESNVKNHVVLPN